jgi:agmatine deiminase
MKYDWYMPAEWEKHRGMLMQWPTEIFKEGRAEARAAYAEVAKKIAEHEKVYLIVRSDLIEEAKSFCSGNIEFLEMEHDDAWARDSCPTFVRTKDKLAMVNWIFNSWGQKFAKWDNDNLIPKRLSEKMAIDCIDVNIVLEGGSIHSNGAGTLLTTKECLLNPNRNPGMTQKDIEKVLMDTLGANKVVWLEYGVYGDVDTDGHIDNVACFVNQDTVLLQACEDKNNPNYERTQSNINTLKQAELNIIKMPQPPVLIENDIYYPLSYVNFVFVNGGVVMPIFGGICKQTDEEAVSIMEKVFPDKKIITVDGMPIIRGGGNVHCITQQIPEV